MQTVVHLGRQFVVALTFELGSGPRSALDTLVERCRDPPRPRMLVYVLGGGDRDLRARALSAVKSDGWSVVDTENDAERDSFVNLIRETGQSAISASPGLFS